MTLGLIRQHDILLEHRAENDHTNRAKVLQTRIFEFFQSRADLFRPRVSAQKRKRLLVQAENRHQQDVRHACRYEMTKWRRGERVVMAIAVYAKELCDFDVVR